MHTSPSSTTSGDNLHFESDDLAETEDFLVRAYTKMSIAAGQGESPSARIERRWLGSVTFDELELDFHMSYDAAPLGRICLCRVHDGRIEENFIGEEPDVFAPGEVALLSPPELPYSGRVCGATFDLTMFDTALLDRVAAPANGRADQGIRLTGHRPVSPQAQQRLSDAIDYVRTVVRSDGLEATPLVASTTASMLAAVVLHTLPSNASLEPTTTDRLDAKPALLRRAIAFIEGNADSDVALGDIAASIHVTPRALQYMFRRHLEMTPMEYLRRVRMDHAHRDLLQADPATTTIQMVASRWGFGHTGRFASMYRDAYGRNPSDTLRN
ncbi:helix-turn-helix transcriptional regulator [Mycolicibacterium gilvum]|uniref:Transcriptional regulator, AraC family n=1 Tax=Mycolicibacterium gilvum (strain DSM 45189 / LMG 24558 / Spyr1) TaxID=278137 RepID=E6THT5_MYCSR|nr:helix-turn-helix transcriptional regulator [Mycolicibacterium gilvum]ADT96834.1 transcriptional regulator, AraC family [Mycolicibacterium gilvum Spyr1]